VTYGQILINIKVMDKVKAYCVQPVTYENS
jgi:hypothetical protein